MPRPERRDRDGLVRLAGEDLQLGGAVGLEGAVAVEVVLGEVEQHGRLGRERDACPRAGTTTPRRRRSCRARACRAARSAPCRRCPPPSTGSPASRWMWPISSTVVVLPLEPVTATNSLLGSSRHPSSSSPSTGDAALAARPRSTGASLGTPGLLTTAARAREQRRRRRCRRGPRRRRPRAARRPPAAPRPESTPATSARRARAARAPRPTPERARPTTRYGPGGGGGRGDHGLPFKRPGGARRATPAVGSAAGACRRRAAPGHRTTRTRSARTPAPAGRVAVRVVDEPELLRRPDPAERGEAAVRGGSATPVTARHAPPGSRRTAASVARPIGRPRGSVSRPRMRTRTPGARDGAAGPARRRLEPRPHPRPLARVGAVAARGRGRRAGSAGTARAARPVRAGGGRAPGPPEARRPAPGGDGPGGVSTAVADQHGRRVAACARCPAASVTTSRSRCGAVGRRPGCRRRRVPRSAAGTAAGGRRGSRRPAPACPTGAPPSVTATRRTPESPSARADLQRLDAAALAGRRPARRRRVRRRARRTPRARASAPRSSSR